eukprot:SAG31_NODE_21616_length_545_cov_0.932735_1_plen_45_part_10
MADAADVAAAAEEPPREAAEETTVDSGTDVVLEAKSSTNSGGRSR